MVSHQLYELCGLDFVVRPYLTLNGRTINEFGDYAVSIYDFVEGTTDEEIVFTPEDRAQVAERIAILHNSATCSALDVLPQENFSLSFVDWLQSVLLASTDTNPPTNTYQTMAREMLIEARQDIKMTLKKLDAIGQRARGLDVTVVLTHGDLSPGNLIKNKGGNFYVIDWSKLLLAPPERDLVYFMGGSFEYFLKIYANKLDQPLHLHPDLFEFYIYRWILAEITDYGSWILLEDASAVDLEHAWNQFQRYLPIQHETVQSGIEEIKEMLVVLK